MTLPDSKEPGKIIQRRRQELGVTQEAFAQSIGLSQPFVGKLERGAADLNTMKLRNFINLLERLEWTAQEFSEKTGIDLSPALTGSHGLQKSETQQERPILTRAEIHVSKEREHKQAKGLDGRQGYFYPDELGEGVELYVTADAPEGRGEIAGINPGDVVYVNTLNREVRDGDLYLLADERQQLRLRRARRVGGALWLISDNAAHPSYLPTTVTTVGRIVGWTRTIRP